MLTVQQMCWLAEVSRAGYYRNLQQQYPVEEEIQVRAAIQEIAVSHQRRYGYRRIAAELRRRGLAVNHKRVLRLLREDNLLAIRRRQFVLPTDSQHELEVYLNLAARMRVDGPDQLWVADLTYIRLRQEFVYLAVILDAWSRRVVGWMLDRTLAARLTVTALERAIAARRPRPGLVHHSDRGVQYASHDYVRLLREHQFTPSMSRPANPYDNATCESFMKTLKQEEIYCRNYRDLPDLEGHLWEFLEQYYNRERLHSALNYRTPEEFEQQAGTSNPEHLHNAPKMSFFRHRKSIDPMKPEGTAGEPGC
jgi:transposase InsO family protein